VKKILIVEDNELSADILKVILQDREFSIETVDNGEKGINKFIESYENGNPYNIVFLDILMPIKNGQQVLEELRGFESGKKISDNEKVKIIMTTSVDNYENVYKSFKNKCDGYLIKPILKEKLFKLIDQIT